MDSVTRPVGHLPPSVYWRRRVLVLLGLAVAIALIAWACSGSGGDKKKNTSATATAPSASVSGAGSAPGVIGPGTNPTDAPGLVGPPVPGGDPGAGTGGSAPAGVAPGAGGGTPAGELPAGQPGAGAPSAGGQPGAATQGAVPAGGGTAPGQGGDGGGAAGGPDGHGGAAPCASGALRVQIVAGKSAYAFREAVDFTVTVTNSGAATCSLDLSAQHAFVDVYSGDDHYWSSADCASTQALSTQLQPGQPYRLQNPFRWSWTRSDRNRCGTDQAQVAMAPPSAGASFSARVTVNGTAGGPFRFQVAGK